MSEVKMSEVILSEEKKMSEVKCERYSCKCINNILCVIIIMEPCFVASLTCAQIKRVNDARFHCFVMSNLWKQRSARLDSFYLFKQRNLIT